MRKINHLGDNLSSKSSSVVCVREVQPTVQQVRYKVVMLNVGKTRLFMVSNTPDINLTSLYK
jgi:hypothetical protein